MIVRPASCSTGSPSGSQAGQPKTDSGEEEPITLRAAERRHVHHIEGIRPGDRQSLLAPTAHLVKPHGGERPDQCKARGQRKQQRQHVQPEGEPRQHQAHHGIDGTQKDDVAAVGAEIFEAFLQSIAQIGGVDMAHGRRRRMDGVLDVLQGTVGRSQSVGRLHDLRARVLDGVLDGLHGRSSQYPYRGSGSPAFYFALALSRGRPRNLCSHHTRVFATAIQPRRTVNESAAEFCSGAGVIAGAAEGMPSRFQLAGTTDPG